MVFIVSSLHAFDKDLIHKYKKQKRHTYLFFFILIILIFNTLIISRYLLISFFQVTKSDLLLPTNNERSVL
jgi:hypothetical protein